MEDSVVLLDTSILIDFFRKKIKQNFFWDQFYENISIFDFDDRCASVAADIVKQLQGQNMIIEIPDILIAATALANNLQIATLNLNHFERIDNLRIIDLS